MFKLAKDNNDSNVQILITYKNAKMSVCKHYNLKVRLRSLKGLDVFLREKDTGINLP